MMIPPFFLLPFIRASIMPIIFFFKILTDQIMPKLKVVIETKFYHLFLQSLFYYFLYGKTGSTGFLLTN